MTIFFREAVNFVFEWSIWKLPIIFDRVWKSLKNFSFGPRTLQKCLNNFDLVCKPTKLVQIFLFGPRTSVQIFLIESGNHYKLSKYYSFGPETLQNASNIFHLVWNLAKLVQIFFIWAENPLKMFKYCLFGPKIIQNYPNIFYWVWKSL